MKKLLRVLAILIVLFMGAVAIAWFASADVRYIIRAGVAEAGILWRREPIERVVADPRTDPRTRGKLLLVLAARSFASDALGMPVKESFTTYSELERDTLVLVLSAARSDRLEPYLWRYPIVGRVPYKGFFSFEEASREARKLERAGLDTYLRPASAFSTLGWFNDPLLSTVIAYDSASLAETVLHELAHNAVFVRNHVDFNESFAEFVGIRGAGQFFRARGDSLLAARVEARWRDERRLAVFYDGLYQRLAQLYARRGVLPAHMREARAAIFRQAATDLAGRVGAQLETINGRWLAQQPLNNAVLLARRVYATELPRFDSALAATGGDLRVFIERVRTETVEEGNPWRVLDRLARTPLPDGR